MKLRPHHLLCVQKYTGNGYDDAFAAGMDALIRRLAARPDTAVTLVEGRDDLCASCPHMAGNRCSSGEKVNRLDRGVLETCGFSAGGHLAATLGVHWRTLGLNRPDGLILCYPVITAEPELCNAESIENITGADRRDFFSLEKHVTPDTPPAFLWHTAADRDVPVENSLLFATAMKRAGVPFELHVYPFGEHGLSLANAEVEQPEKGRLPDPHVAGWIGECEAWLDQMLPRLAASH